MELSQKQKDKFWARVDKSAGDNCCWPWTKGRCKKRGYGKVNYKNRQYKSHRIAYMLSIGPISDGLLICHHCDNPPCCNPSHLYQGNYKTNAEDTIARGRRPIPKHKRLFESMIPDIAALLAVNTRAEVAKMFGVGRRTLTSFMVKNCFGRKPRPDYRSRPGDDDLRGIIVSVKTPSVIQ